MPLTGCRCTFRARIGVATPICIKAGQRVHEALDQLAEQVELLRDVTAFRPLSVNAALHGVHFVNKIFGQRCLNSMAKKATAGEVPEFRVGNLKRPDLENARLHRAPRCCDPVAVSRAA